MSRKTTQRERNSRLTKPLRHSLNRGGVRLRRTLTEPGDILLKKICAAGKPERVQPRIARWPFPDPSPSQGNVRVRRSLTPPMGICGPRTRPGRLVFTGQKQGFLSLRKAPQDSKLKKQKNWAGRRSCPSRWQERPGLRLATARQGLFFTGSKQGTRLLQGGGPTPDVVAYNEEYAWPPPF
jgi:hypothetical protein